MREGIAKKLLVLTICLVGIFFAGASQAENEAVFDLATWELNVPKLVVGSDAYAVTMKLGAQGFIITDYRLNNASGYASGTYNYNPSTNILGANFTQSTFIDGGPHGYSEVSVISLTETMLTVKEPDGDIKSWTRISGTGTGLEDQWISEDSDSARKIILELSAGNIIKYSEEYTYFSPQKKTISIDGDFSDWEERDRVYMDSDGPECQNVPGRDLKEVYVTYDNYFTYVRFVLNGPLDETFGYKFGNSIHVNVQNNTIMYASGSLLSNGITLPNSFLAINGNQIEWKTPSLGSWYNQPIQAWIDQGTETICRDHVNLPLLIGGEGPY